MAIEGTNCEDMCRDTCYRSNNGICDDGGLGSDYSRCSLGTDCTDCGARLPEANDCYFEKPSGEYKSFRAGNVYKLVMTFPSGVESWDDDDGGTTTWWDTLEWMDDETCAEERNREPAPASRQSGHRNTADERQSRNDWPAPLDHAAHSPVK